MGYMLPAPRENRRPQVPEGRPARLGQAHCSSVRGRSFGLSSLFCPDADPCSHHRAQRSQEDPSASGENRPAASRVRPNFAELTFRPLSFRPRGLTLSLMRVLRFPGSISLASSPEDEWSVCVNSMGLLFVVRGHAAQAPRSLRWLRTLKHPVHSSDYKTIYHL